MDSRSGKAIRLKRIFGPEDNKALIMAYSHSIIYGAIKGMKNIAEIKENLSQVVDEVDAVILNPGTFKFVEELFYGKDKAAVILQVDYQNYSRKEILPYYEGSTQSLFSLADALKAGVDAVMSYLYFGSADPEIEAAEIKRNQEYIRQSREYGIPLIIEPRFAREKVEPEKKAELEIMKLYTRITQDLGADIIKMIYPGSTAKLSEIISCLDIPVLIAGGENKGKKQTIANAEAYLSNGASGIIFGRSIFQSENPKKLSSKLKSIVHS
ncbi:hypothetical protein LJ207_09805 [Halanaerobium sp. Z-7514]|uniref:Fructose-bisphosphate aldolase n=1 Tax=Halanaerobium polyolivorans TaxID=2886943 RepID=A0AAW4X1G2_9FIRM|nr:hypothetical protein [Halanaerobium polyolivorans]MCC3145617.1 hypothetical protein [Halanaerobium polyolivorans]